jgi:hypothetical protein
MIIIKDEERVKEMPKKISKKCKGCRRLIYRKDIFCSPECNKIFNDRKYGVCKKCGKRLNTESKRNMGFCNIICRAEYHDEHKKLWKPCKCCGKMQNQWRDLLSERPAYSESNFCSHKCRRTDKNKKQSIKIKNKVAKRFRDGIREALESNGRYRNGRSVMANMPWDYGMICDLIMGTLPDGLILKDCHIDHIVPQCYFDYESDLDPEFLLCWCPDNLQLLPVEDNLAKGNQYMGELGETIEDAKGCLRKCVEGYLTNYH